MNIVYVSHGSLYFNPFIPGELKPAFSFCAYTNMLVVC